MGPRSLVCNIYYTIVAVFWQFGCLLVQKPADFRAIKRPPSGTKFGRFIAQNSAAFWHCIRLLLVQKPANLLNQKRPPSGTNSAALLHKIRLLACTKTGRFSCNKAAAFWYKIRPLYCKIFGRLLLQKAAHLLN